MKHILCTWDNQACLQKQNHMACYPMWTVPHTHSRELSALGQVGLPGEGSSLNVQHELSHHGDPDCHQMLATLVYNFHTFSSTCLLYCYFLSLQYSLTVLRTLILFSIGSSYAQHYIRFQYFHRMVFYLTILQAQMHTSGNKILTINWSLDLLLVDL